MSWVNMILINLQITGSLVVKIQVGALVNCILIDNSAA